MDEIGHKDHVRVDDTEQVTVAICACQPKHGRDERCAILITLHLGNVLDTQLTRRFGEPRLFAQQNHLSIGKQSPRFDRVALDRRDVRIGEWFGGGK